MTIAQRLFIWLQYLLPQHFLSRLMLRLTRLRSRALLNLMLPWFIRRFGVNMQEATEPDWRHYGSFNEFFTRALKSDARSLAEGDSTLACPVDGATSQFGRIDNDCIFQAKGQSYTLSQLLGGDPKLVDEFRDGDFATLYLSPRDYHRIHMPVSGKLRQVIHVPGKLFSVNPTTTQGVPALFARNERAVCVFDTAVGPMAMILVGAIFVASIETVWQGVITPPRGKRIQNWDFTKQDIQLGKGEEMGRFNMGSTVILLFGKQAIEWTDLLQAGKPVRMGQALAQKQ